MDLGNATEPYRALFANGSVPLSMLGEDHDFAEFELLLLCKSGEVRKVIDQLRGAMQAFRSAAPTHDAILDRLLDPAETRRPQFGTGGGWTTR